MKVGEPKRKPLRLVVLVCRKCGHIINGYSASSREEVKGKLGADDGKEAREHNSLHHDEGPWAVEEVILSGAYTPKKEPRTNGLKFTFKKLTQKKSRFLAHFRVWHDTTLLGTTWSVCGRWAYAFDVKEKLLGTTLTRVKAASALYCARADALIKRSAFFLETDWAKPALDHIAADKSCGRAWSCECGACRHARSALGIPVTAR